MAAPGWLDEVALSPEGPPWLAMGLSRVDEAAWLAPDEARDTELAERARLLDERHDEVFAAEPGTEAASAEVLAHVRSWLAGHRPDLVLPPSPPGLHPLEAAARLVQEDLCLVVEHDGVPHLDAACLCFPSHWRLAEKIGLPMAAVHGPVPRYADDLQERVDRYLTRLRPGVIGARRNWTVHERPDLFAPDRPAPTAVDPADLWLRSERQTLRRLPESGAVLFTIRVQQVRMGQLAERPTVAAALAARIRAQPDELTEMNGVTPHRAELLAVLGTWASS